MTFPFWCCGSWCGSITRAEWVDCLPEQITLNLTVERINRTIDDGGNIKNEQKERLTFTDVKMIIDPINLDRMIPMGGSGNGTWHYHFEYTSYNYATGSFYAPNLSPPFDQCPDCKQLFLCETVTRDGTDVFSGYEFYIDCHDPCNIDPNDWINQRNRIHIEWDFHHDENQAFHQECEYSNGSGNGYTPDNMGLYTSVLWNVWGLNGCLNQKTFSCKSFYTPFTTNNPLLPSAGICTGAYNTPFECDLSNETGPYPATFYCNSDWYVETCPFTACLDTHSCWTQFPGGSVTKDCNCFAPNFSGQGTRKYTDEGSLTIGITVP